MIIVDGHKIRRLHTNFLHPVGPHNGAGGGKRIVAIASQPADLSLVIYSGQIQGGVRLHQRGIGRRVFFHHIL